MTARSTEYFHSSDQSLHLNGQTKPTKTRKASAAESIRFPAVNHRLVSQVTGLIASSGSGFMVVGLVTAALVALQPGDWLRVVASFAAMSGFIYLGLAMNAEDVRNGLIDTVTGILMFVLAYAAFNGQLIFLTLAFAVGVVWALKELWFKPRQAFNTNLLAGWTSINLGASLMLMHV